MHSLLGHRVASTGMAGDYHGDRDRRGKGRQGEPAHQARDAGEVASDHARRPQES